MPDQPSGSPEPVDSQRSSTPENPPGTEPARDGDTAGEDATAGSAEPNSSAPAGAPAGSQESVDLLNQILNRLQHMEGGLSQHEQWLRRIEEEQQQAETAAKPTAPGAQSEDELQRLVGSLTLDRDRGQKALAEAEQQLGQYQQELVALRKQTADLQTRLSERERELGALKSAATKGAEQARSIQSQAQRQLQAHQQQTQSLQTQLAATQRQLADRDRQITELQSAVEQAAERFEVFSADLAARTSEDVVAGMADRSWSRFARVAVVAAFLSGLASVGLTSWLHQRSHSDTLHAVSTTLLLPGTDAQTFKACADKAGGEPGIEVTSDPKRGTIELRLHAADCDAAKARLDKLAGALVASLGTPTYASLARPATQPAAVAIVARVAKNHEKLDEPVRPIGESAHQNMPSPTELTAQRQALADERSQIEQKLRELTRRLEAAESQPASAHVATDLVARAEAADQQLQAETEALKQREDQLAGRLRVTIDTAALQFQSLQQALAEADAQLQNDLQDDHPEEVGNQLITVRESLKTWARALTDLDSAWKTQRGVVNASGGGDVLSVQSALERSARGFVTEITTADAAMAKAVESIGQGQDQTTKRLVLRNALTKQLAPVTTAQQMVSTAARAVILTDNVELTAIVQRLDALRKQIQQRRIQITDALRQERLAELQKQQSIQVAGVRQEQQVLTRRAAEIDSRLLELGEQAMHLASEHAQQSQRLASRAALLENQAADLKSLVEMHNQFAENIASLPPPPAPGFLPATVLAATTGGMTFLAALLLGVTPVLVCAAVLALAWLIISSRKSRQTIEEYARTLKETARRASLNDEAPVP